MTDTTDTQTNADLKASEEAQNARAKKIAYVVLFLLTLLCFWIYEKQQQNKIETLQSEIKIADGKSTIFSTSLNKSHQIVASQAQLLVTQDAALNELKVQNKKLHTVIAGISTTTKTDIREIKVPFETKVEVKVIDSNNFMRVPIAFTDTATSEWYKITGSIDTSGIKFKSIEIINKLNIVIGSEKSNFFSKPKPIVMITNENPYSSTIQLKNIVVKDEPKWYDSKLLWGGLGFIIGVAVLKL